MKIPSNKIFNFGSDIQTLIYHCPYVLLEQEEGVETLDIFTRYRFRIGVVNYLTLKP